jgi:outer membrane protein TolC
MSPALCTLLALVVPAAPAAEASEPWSLERAIAYAQRHSPDAVTARERIRKAGAMMDEATATFLPQLEFGVRYAATDTPAAVFANLVNQEVFPNIRDPNVDFDFNDLSANDDLNLRATIELPLYAGGARFAARRAATAGQAAAEHGREAVERELAFQVTRAYLGVLQARAFEGAAEAAVEAFESNLEIARRRFEAGSLLKQNLLDVEVRLSRAREDLVRIRNGEALARRALANVMGLDGGEPVDVLDLPPELAAPPDGSVADRPELRALGEQLEAAEAGVNRARAGYIPTVGAFSTLMFDQGFIEDGNRFSWMAGVAVEWQAFDGLGTQARVRQAKADASVTAQSLRKTRLGLSFEAEQARIQLEDVTERLGVTAKEVELAEESAELTRDRFEEGLAISTQLIDAETALTAARVRRSQSEIDRLLAVATLRKALGLPILESPNDGE